MNKEYLEVLNHEWHRNGISGEGFYVVHFNWNDPEDSCKNMIATIFDDEKYIAILCLDDISQKWRGDYFEDMLREYIKLNN